LLRSRGESTERYCCLGFVSITHIACWLIRNCFCFQPINPPSEQYFLKVWKEKVPWLKCRAYHKFMMCDECISINDRMRTSRNEAEASWFLIVALTISLHWHLMLPSSLMYAFRERNFGMKEGCTYTWSRKSVLSTLSVSFW
jgi:hypothetical protein